jgi:hypothetical protein
MPYLLQIQCLLSNRQPHPLHFQGRLATHLFFWFQCLLGLYLLSFFPGTVHPSLVFSHESLQLCQLQIPEILTTFSFALLLSTKPNTSWIYFQPDCRVGLVAFQPQTHPNQATFGLLLTSSREYQLRQTLRFQARFQLL